jgi:hypothetical protein
VIPITIRTIALGGLILLASGAQAQIAFRAASSASAATGGAPTFVATASAVVNAASATVARPAGVAQNDVLIAQVTVKDVQAITPPGAAGDWNLVDLTSTSTAGNEMTQAVYWRRVGAIGTEPATYAWSFSSGARALAAVTAYRNVNPVGNPVNVSAVNSGNAAAAMTLPTLTTTQNNTLLVALLGSSRAGNVHGVPTGMTVERYELGSGAGPNGVTGSLDEQAQASAGTTGAKTATMSTATDYVAHLLALTGGSALTIAVPPGTVLGDVMVASIAVRPCTAAASPCTVTVGTPAGWTLVSTTDQTGGGSVGDRLAVYWRVATAVDPGATYTWSFAGAPVHTGAVAGIASFSGVDTTSPVLVSAGQATPSSRSHAAPSVITGTQTDTMLVSSHAANAAASWTAPAGMTEAVDVASLPLTNNLGISLEMNWQTQALAAPAPGGTGTRTATFSNPPNANTGTTHMLALRPLVTLAHYNIAAAANPVATCDYAQITFTGHDASDNPVAPPANRTLSISTAPASGVWQAGTVSGTGAWTPSGSTATYLWPGGETSFTVRLRQYTAASININLNDGSGIKEGATLTEDPPVDFVGSAFRISDGANAALPIGTQIAGKPSNTGFGQQTLYLQAIAGSGGACGTLLPANTDVTIEVGAQCNNPASCTNNVTLTSSALAGNTATFTPNGGFPATMSFRFTGANSEAQFALNYVDAGQITLQFRVLMTGSATDYVQGTSNAFVVRPFGIAFPGIHHANSPSGATGSLFPGVAAGDNFSMTVTAYQWAAGEDANNDGVPDSSVDITNNGTTPNYAATVTVGTGANLPNAAGVTPQVSRGPTCAIVPATIALAGGTATAADWCYNEVGNVVLTATAANYLGSGQSVTGDSGLDGDIANGPYVGRFRPKHFALLTSAAPLTPTLTTRSDLACPGSTFTYMDETLRLTVKVAAQNAQNATTLNYSGAYLKLNATSFASWGLGAVSGGTNLTSRIDSGVAPTGGWSSGVADMTLITSILRKPAPDDPDGPYPALQFGIAPNDGETTMNTLDLNVAGSNDHKSLGFSTEVRYGRLRMDNALGSETHRLAVPMRVEYWNGSGFATNLADSCTSLARSAIAMAFTPPSNLTSCETALDVDPVTFTSGVAKVGLTAPGGGNSGSVVLTANLGSAGGSYCNPGSFVAAGSAPLSYLLGRWDDAANPDGDANTNYDDKPSARAAFGLYGSQPGNFIYFREQY